MWKELEGKRICVFDAETDGFLENMTQVHCLVGIDASKPEVPYAERADYKDFTDYLDSFDVLVGHNIIGYDLPMLKQQFGWVPKEHVIFLDTLWLSRLYYCDIEGGHSLGAWGARLGEPKTEYYPISDPDQPLYNPEEKVPKKNPCWQGSIWTQNMEDYCVQDVAVNVKLFWKLVTLLKNFTWKSIKCEMDTAVIIQRQMEHGFVFDYKKAEVLHGTFIDRVGELEDEVHETFKPIAKFVKEIQPKVRMNGTLSSVGLKKHIDIYGSADIFNVPEFTRHIAEDGTKSVEYHSGSYSAVEWPEFSLGSRAQIAERLTRAGYKLTEFTEKGTPMINDAVLQIAADAGIAEAKPLAEYFMITKREGMVKDWLSKVKWGADGYARIHGYVNSLGAATNRMTHSSPNIAQVPSSSSPYGNECRSLFTVREGYKLVGCDAAGLELRCLANYMNDPEYTNAILHGDVHWANTLALGLVPKGTVRDKKNAEHSAARDMSKTFIYAFLYGAGDAKIGQIIGGGGKEGKALKAKFLNATPALKKLREGIASAVKDRSWIKGIDGRIIRVRSPHAALNTLLQGMGAIVMKYWLIEVTKNADAAGLDWNPSANVHDEGQFEVINQDVTEFKKICEAAFPKVSEILKTKCLLEGEAMEGDNWLATH